MRRRPLRVAALAVGACLSAAAADALDATTLGVVFRRGDAASGNLVSIDIPDTAVIAAQSVERLRVTALRQLPGSIEALLLVWTRPYAAGCMSITSAFAAGYRAEFCEPGCGRTAPSPLFDADSLAPALRRGWRPAMQLPSADNATARALIRRGMESDGTHPTGDVYLVSSRDLSRNVRAAGYADVVRTFGERVVIHLVDAPEPASMAPAIAYFTGVAQVAELRTIRFMPGAVADHLTSLGGIADQSAQTTALEWLNAGATASYGTVSEPCNHTGKFPSPIVFISHYLRGETVLEAYWKSVAMPGQGLFVGEPLAAPYATQRLPRTSAMGTGSWGR